MSQSTSLSLDLGSGKEEVGPGNGHGTPGDGHGTPGDTRPTSRTSWGWWFVVSGDTRDDRFVTKRNVTPGLFSGGSLYLLGREESYPRFTSCPDTSVEEVLPEVGYNDPSHSPSPVYGRGLLDSLM